MTSLSSKHKDVFGKRQRLQSEFGTHVLGILLAITLTFSLSGQVGEYQVKAFFLYNLARYVEWPAQNFKAPGDPIVICIFGRNPFGKALGEAIDGKTVEGRAFIIRQIPEIQPNCNCHILFVNSSEKERYQAAASRLQGSGILTVGETPGFAADGGVVNFKLEDEKVRFEINTEVAVREHLHISSKLLRLAEIVSK